MTEANVLANSTPLIGSDDGGGGGVPAHEHNANENNNNNNSGIVEDELKKMTAAVIVGGGKSDEQEENDALNAKITLVKNVDEKERISLRAKRFGGFTNTTLKKEERAKRFGLSGDTGNGGQTKVIKLTKTMTTGATNKSGPAKIGGNVNEAKSKLELRKKRFEEESGEERKRKRRLERFGQMT